MKHDSILRKTEDLTFVPLLNAHELIGDFGRKPDEIVDLAVMKGDDLYCGMILCREGIQKGIIEMENCLLRFAVHNDAMTLSDVTLCFE